MIVMYIIEMEVVEFKEQNIEVKDDKLKNRILEPGKYAYNLPPLKSYSYNYNDQTNFINPTNIKKIL